MSLRDALALRPVQRQLRDGSPYWLRRPSALDLIEAIEFQRSHSDRMHAWMCWRHALDRENDAFVPVFDSLEAALAAPAQLVTEIATEADRLYSEGRD